VFWNKVAHEWADLIEPFIGDSREVREAAAALVAGAATPDEKLRKLYARAQQIRNTSFEPEKSENESRKLRDNHRAQDVLRNGYGGLTDINRLFVAMARGAGFDAHVVRVSEPPSRPTNEAARF
jgi:transglutaminase-like putative cysteine protease